MTYSLKISNGAEFDLEDGFSWYEEKQKDLGITFIEHTESLFNRLIKTPLLYPQKHTYKQIDIRVAPLEKFPYIILYHINEDNKQVIILAVFHTSLDPNKWRRRLK